MIFAALEAKIDKLGDDDSNLNSSNSEDSSGNSHLRFHKNPTSFTGTKKFKIDPEDSVQIPGVNTRTGGVLL